MASSDAKHCAGARQNLAASCCESANTGSAKRGTAAVRAPPEFSARGVLRLPRVHDIFSRGIMEISWHFLAYCCFLFLCESCCAKWLDLTIRATLPTIDLYRSSSHNAAFLAGVALASKLPGLCSLASRGQARSCRASCLRYRSFYIHISC